VILPPVPQSVYFRAMSAHTALPGFRDFYPAEFAVRAHIIGAWQEVSRRYGFEQYDGPPLESLELYVEKSGEEIVRQLYNFTDKGEREVALRPEMTPTLARMVGAQAGSLRKPIRWFSTPQLFRYERMQRGRLREHFQWNVDIVGDDDIAADAEVLAVALDGLRFLGLRSADIVARFNDRRLLEAVLTDIGVPPDRLLAAYSVIDRLGREPLERVADRLRADIALDTAAVDRLLALFAETGGLQALAAAHGHNEAVARSLRQLERYQNRLVELGLGDYIRFDISIVRGLAYYTGTVFEIFDRRGELRAVCGGGRYDRLLASVSDADLPAAGFGMGDVVLKELLRDRALLPDSRPTVDVFLVGIDEQQQPLLLELAQRLRASGCSVLYTLRPLGVGKQLKEADARGARRALLLGPDELSRGAATVRTMASGEQREVTLEQLRQDPGAALTG
jgi:histidyl-tRNA synthetase